MESIYRSGSNIQDKRQNVLSNARVMIIVVRLLIKRASTSSKVLQLVKRKPPGPKVIKLEFTLNSK